MTTDLQIALPTGSGVLRIALLLDNLASGGAQRRIATLANRMAELGHAVDVVSAEPGGAMLAMLSPNVQVMTLLARKTGRWLTLAVHAPRLARYLDQARPAVLMSCVTDTHLLAVIGHRLARHRASLVLRASRHPLRSLPWSRKLLEPIKLRKTVWCYAHADAIVALSDDCADGLRRLLPHRPARIVTIPNPVVDRTLLDEPRGAELRKPAPVPIILGVGRLVEQKDFSTLLHAFALVLSRRPARLVLLGQGPQRDPLQALARRLGIAAHVDFRGEVANVDEWMMRADLLVSSSLWEGLQAAPIEALAAGCPVVATDCPGAARETLQDGRIGPLVPVRDPAAMAAAICAVLDDPPDPLVLAASATRFTPQGKAERYLDLFDELLGTASQAPDMVLDYDLEGAR